MPAQDRFLMSPSSIRPFAAVDAHRPIHTKLLEARVAMWP